MWIVFSLLSALFAGITSILAKCGIRRTSSTVATALRTIVVLLCAWCVVFTVGSHTTIATISERTLIFLALSGVTTGASWLCYFKALQRGDVNKVVPIDKSSTALTVVLSLALMLEPVTYGKIIGVLPMIVGTFLMIAKKQSDTVSVAPDAEPNKSDVAAASDGTPDGKQEKRATWMIFAVLSAVFSCLTAIFGKIGIDGVESNLGTAIRTSVVLVMAWLVVAVTPERKKLCRVPKRELLFIALSGIATGASWLCYFKALQDGSPAAVISIDKLSIVVTIIFSYVVFKEKLSLKAGIGFVLLVAGTFAMLF